ncbi:MAG: hypothetical protein IPM33_13590 [Phycisphaerales bacterium]|nr:hypothetical protein [Phycisphaerales bacterium]
MTIPAKIATYHQKILGDIPGRYRSWEHCFKFFRQFATDSNAVDKQTAALHLAVYLASWGMYRGSTFLLQYDYTIQLRVVECISHPSMKPLWTRDVGSSLDDLRLAPLVLDAAEAVRAAYKPFGNATDTLVTKVLLGTIGCLPAVDRFFIDGFKSRGFKCSYLNQNFVRRVMEFTHANLDLLRLEQVRIKTISGVHYPLMKLVDMYFWQIGYEQSPEFDDSREDVPGEP